jgi:aspartyl aminopeptidase
MEREVAWKKYNETDINKLNELANDYKKFLSNNKTEREITREVIRRVEEKGFRNLDELISNNMQLVPNDKIYVNNRNKSIALFVIGEEPLENGMNILGAHIDSPRLDVKANPLYEEEGFVYLDTHYYGGIKKYQWVTTPLAIHGVIVKKDGTTVNINIGEKESDPVFCVSDLLPHLAEEQMKKEATKVVEGENLDLLFGSRPNNEEEDPTKKYILELLKEKYDIDEEDFISAEIEIVPAGPARDYGLDRSMVAGYGHDDRSCAYTSLMALLDTKKVDKTACCILVDKEEIGSVGATGAQSLFFENAIAKLLALAGNDHPLWAARLAMENSEMLSSDVSAGFDPLYPSVNDPKNAAYLGEGLVFNKYTGSRGKSGSNDSMPEYYAFIRNTMDEAKVNWQNAELGRVDQGGGGTIAYILGNYNMRVIDAGIPVLNMHAPMEIVSKVDVYEAYLGYKAFLAK